MDMQETNDNDSSGRFSSEETAGRHAKAWFSKRWLPLGLLLLAVAGVLFVQNGLEVDQQKRNVYSWMVSGIAGFLLLIWVFGLSLLTTSSKLKLLLAMVVIVGLGFGLLKIKKTDGDLVPQFVWRWSQPPDVLLDPLEIGPIDPVVGYQGEKTVGLHDYPQFLGPARNGEVKGLRLKTDWDKSPPRELWRRAIGAGWSSFAVKGKKAITQEQRGPDEMVVCYDVLTGEPFWQHIDKARYKTTLGGIGPRATPTIAHAQVFTVGATGILNCLSLHGGKLLWSRNILDDADAPAPQWGVSCSPLVVGDLVIVSSGVLVDNAADRVDADAGFESSAPGKSLAAYDRLTGELVWAGGRSSASYGSPMLATFHGEQQILMLNHLNVTGHDLKTGKPLWHAPWPGANPKVSQPVMLGENRLFVSSGYTVGSAVFQVERSTEGKWSAKQSWKNIAMKSKLSTIVRRGDHVYGFNDGILACVNTTSGKRTWRGGRYGHGQLILVGDHLLVLAEAGYIALVQARPIAFRELTRFEVLKDKTWNTHALAGKFLLVRNDQEVVCLELKVEDTDSKKSAVNEIK
jgi:outer membrane protein assembly factor BamB